MNTGRRRRTGAGTRSLGGLRTLQLQLQVQTTLQVQTVVQTALQVQTVVQTALQVQTAPWVKTISNQTLVKTMLQVQTLVLTNINTLHPSRRNNSSSSSPRLLRQSAYDGMKVRCAVCAGKKA